MGRRIYLTDKQERQIISFFENSHAYLCDPNDISSAAVVTLFRACKRYCNRLADGGCCSKDKEGRAKNRQGSIEELIDTLDKLSVRYYERI